MAEEAFGKTVKQLKQERTSANGAFTKQANYLSKAADGLVKHELQEEFNKPSSLARCVSDANEDYRAGLLADTEAGTEKGEEVKLDMHQQAELEKTIGECDARLGDIREAVQSNLWPRYGEEELYSAIEKAEEACERAQASPITAINRDGFELQLRGEERLIHEAIANLKDWEKWIPHDQTAHLKGRLKDQRTFGSNLEGRRAEFLTAQRIAEEKRRGSEPQLMAVPQPVPQAMDGLGACLLQDGHPIAYTSRALTEPERNYTQIERELLAIVSAVRKFHQHAYGVRVDVQSDHKPLENILKKPLDTALSRLQRMLLQLQKYDLNVLYKPGKELLIADKVPRGTEH
ncbi:hypothetical protein JOB18_004401 [Solea senegalensis]|uniref:Reverse transcriptase RNase H-like domain-containing protein n=1 Tax=Solea senegalensis TaxID=28829 RepID=A0AAV6PP21_SOLSE|nr:hypothetical protein JOB18_004401 [Solea senegalensis]